jgi:hypothetical protein
VEVRIALDDREVRNSLKALRREGPKAIADAINRTMFELRDAEQVEVSGAFLFSGPNTQRFLSRSFRFQGATATKLSATLYVLPGSRTILERQQFGDTVRLGEEDVGPGFDAQLAVPQDIKRTASGRIPAARLPKRLLLRTRKGRSRAYIAGRAVFERIPGQRLGRFLFALATQARIKPTLDFFVVAERTARRELPKKANRVLEKLNLRRGR